MNAAEALKNSGNAEFMSGNNEAATDFYRRALQSLEDEPSADVRASQGFNELKRNVHSNMANALLASQQYEPAWNAAASALEIDKTFLKASLRYVEAKVRGGLPFDALVYALRNTRPLLRAQTGSAAKEAAAALDNLESEMKRKLGLSRLASGVELVDFAGGVALISRQHFAPNDVVFVEQKYKTNFDETSLNVEAGLTTEKIVLHFAEHLRPEQKANSTRWETFRKQFAGAWPRSMEEIDPFTLRTVGGDLRKHFPDLESDAFNELLLASLMCRYNCFHAGFFRACALANHSCRANIAMKYSTADETVTMIAVSPIKPGELMNVKYLNDAHFLLGLSKRRELLRSWLFWCECDRCLEDNEPASAVQEYVTCRECGRYTHYPIPAPRRRDIEVDPLISGPHKCTHCGADVSWDTARQDELNSLIVAPTETISAQQLGMWLVDQLNVVGRLGVHPAHWSYRILFYFFCVSLNGVLQQRISYLRMKYGNLSVHEEGVRDVLSDFGFDDVYGSLLERTAADPQYAAAAVAVAPGSRQDDACPHSSASVLADVLLVGADHSKGRGCDALRSLRVLWNMISPFYPSHEMWAIHKMICDCVLLHLTFQSQLRVPENSRLAVETAVALLQQHGPFLGDVEANRWLHLFSLLRSFLAKDEERALPNTNQLKKMLKLK